MTALFGAAYEQEGQWPYQPLIEAFDRYLAEHRGPAAAGGSGGEPRANPITHFRRPGVVLAGGAVLEGGSGDPQREHWALFDAAAGFLLDLAAEAPVVLLVDDLHAADQSTLHLFHYLARQTRAAPVTLLATYRTDVPATPASPFAALLNALYRERLSQTSSLAPLEMDALGSVLADTLGGEAAPELVKAVFEVAEGNPFHAQEIARALLKSGEVLAEVGSLSLEFELGVRIPVSNSKLQTQTPNSEGGEVEQHARRWRLKPGAELRVPSGLSALLRERVMRLGPPVESALTAAAVIGREFNFEVLRATASLPDGELFDALDAALAGHLLEETDGGYRFRHSLIRRALYDSLSRVRRARLHTRAAEAIELTHARGPEGLRPHAEALAFHYDLSDRRDRALDYLVQAGERAAGVYAFEVAVDYFQRALALMDALGLADPARRWQLLESLGRWGIILADTPRAVAHFEQAIALFPPPAPQRSPAERQGRGVPEVPPSGGLGAAADVLPSGGLGGQGWQPARRDRARLHGGAAMALLTAGQTAAAEAHLRAGLGEVDEDEDAAEYADLLYNLAQLHWHRDEYELAFGAAQRSLAVAERLNHREAIARAFEMLALVCHSLGEWQTGIGYEEQRAALTGPGLDVTDAFDVHL
jgi:tetratricopeptide (TPR) repeat protein